MSRPITVFFYGLFMDADLLRSKGCAPSSPRRASLSGFSLRIGRRATLVPDDLGRVHGLVMQLRHAEIDQLYSDPSVQMYRPEPVIAELEDGSQVAALCFNLPEGPSADERNEEYARRLIDLARRLGLPAGYVERIA